MRILKFIILSAFMLMGITLHAQERTISGKVLDVREHSVIGAAVMLEGTNHGVTTSLDGSFSITVPKGDVVLNVSSIGFIAIKTAVPANKNNVTIFMQDDIIQLESAVVVGYGTQKRVNLTGAVSTVESDKLENHLSHSVTNMLQGSVAGLNVTTSSGRPGATGAINIRGVNSINSAAPLVVIDGVTGDTGDLNRLNPNDVDNISVIKDASAAAIYGARAAFGVILVTTKSGSTKDSKAIVRYSGRIGWEQPTTSTDYENRGYWSVYTINKFWWADSGTNYIKYNDYDMQQLLARINDKTEHPDRPWVVEQMRNGRKHWVYYGNYDWWDMMFREKRPVRQDNVSITGGSKDIKYLFSANYNRQEGMQRTYPDIFDRYNLRSKVDFKINKWTTLSNNSSFFASQYKSIGDGSIENTIGYGARHALACFPMKNPDGSWLYSTPYLNYKVGNGRHIMLNENTHRNLDVGRDFSNTTRLIVKPIEQLNITADFTYRFYQTQSTSRSSELWYREYPDSELASYNTGAGENQLDESVSTRHFYSTNVFANYKDTFKDDHHLAVTGGFNYEYFYRKSVSAWGRDLSSITLDDLNLVGQNEAGVTETGVGGGQVGYALLGFFARVNYDYLGRYLFEVSGRYDGTSRFAKEHRWGWFPSASAGWRISEEPFFEPAKDLVDNLKLRLSFGSLGNQSVSSYYTYMRLISIRDFAGYTFGEGGAMGKYSSLGAPIASDLTWETAQQWNLGVDFSMLSNRFNLMADVYIRDTKDMLTAGVALPGVYGASSPDMNAADLRTKGYELTLRWRDQFQLFGKPFQYDVSFNLSDYQSVITKYDNPNKSFAKSYYEGMRIGEIWGFVTDGYFKTDEEAKAYAQEVNLSYSSGRLTGGWQAGDLKFVDLDGDGIWGIGQNTVDSPGDRKILGNSLPSLSYGITTSFNWMGIDFSAFFQGTGNHYWYPHGQTMNFWGGYSYPYMTFMPRDFIKKVWAEDNPDAYFPRARAYSATGGYLAKVNDRYLQNLRYLRLKNLTVGYTLPLNLTNKVGIDKVRVYFSGENLFYVSPLKKNTEYIDPEAGFDRSGAYNNAYYPRPKTFMFGIDITF